MGTEPLVAAKSRLAAFLSGLAPTSVDLSLWALKSASDAGDAGLTRRTALRTLEALSRSPRTLSRKVRAARPRPPRRRVDERCALEALADLQVALASGGIRPFLMFGTLLGAVRQQGFIPGDGDVDLAIIGGESAERIPRLVADSPIEVARIDRQGAPPVKVLVRHRNGSELEIKVAEREADGAVTWWTNTGHPFAFRKRFPGGFGIRQIEFLGLTVHVPDRAEDFLEWQYGPGWRVPDPGYHPVTSGPLHGPEHWEFCRIAGPMHVVRMLYLGRPAKALAMARSMGGHFPDEDLWPRFITALEVALGEFRAPQAACPAAGRSAR